MKKDVIKQLTVVTVISVLLVLLFAGGYYYGSKIDNNELVTIKAEEHLPEGITAEELLDSDTEYVLESHDLDSDEISYKTEKLPVEFIGLAKNDVIDYITSHKEQFQEKNEEIQNVSMISFSNDTLVLRKDVTESMEISETVTYFSEEAYHYYIVLEEGTLVVYKQDKTTVFLETGITVEDLEEEEREQLTRGIGIKNISELYRYLEGYTS